MTPLRAMTGLTFLDLYHTTVTKAGFDALKAVLPQCEIAYDDRSGRRLKSGE